MHRLLRSTWRRLGPYDSDSFKERMRRCQQKFHVVVVTRTIEKNNLIWWNYSTILLAALTLSSIWSSVWVDNGLVYVKTPPQSCIILNHTHRVIYLGSKWVCPKTGYLKKYDYHYPIWSVSNNWPFPPFPHRTPWKRHVNAEQRRFPRSPYASPWFPLHQPLGWNPTKTGHPSKPQWKSGWTSSSNPKETSRVNI